MFYTWLHWARACTEKAEEQESNQEIYLISHSEQAEYTLMATTDEKLNNMSLLGETVGCIVLDSGTTFQCFIETLSDDLKKKWL